VGDLRLAAHDLDGVLDESRLPAGLGHHPSLGRPQVVERTLRFRHGPVVGLDVGGAPVAALEPFEQVDTPLGRLGDVSELVGATVFLASQASAFVTGQVIRVDGGISAGIAWPIEL